LLESFKSKRSMMLEALVINILILIDGSWIDSN
jgi:hypothetical protein